MAVSAALVRLSVLSAIVNNLVLLILESLVIAGYYSWFGCVLSSLRLPVFSRKS